ncbi:enoyl-CoA hydratase [Pedomonas mirosovicensis]|uniref:enoyl-CoA hydratase n=1 Tax=Pedomonas mirosovicensis TaxID=2908641 RepID=UPI00216AAEB0|nr:enoyl-CoA hydratase [Pedomonas mirosovicensis]MCH8684737.1 enoyl-CoA hydratase [Pedomonas mirosovicensis]
MTPAMSESAPAQPPAFACAHISIKADGPLLWLRFNRPEKRNALTVAMYAALADALEAAAANPAIRAVILAGACGTADDIFTSGNDLGDFLANPIQNEDAPVLRFLRAISAFPKPLIAAVAGPAVGVGATMLLHCDLVYAADNASFQFPFASIGLVPEAGSTFLLPRLVGHARASELFFFGESIDAETARDFGLVNAVVPVAELPGHAEARARKLAAQPASALRRTKALMREARNLPLADAMRVEGQAFMERLQSPEAREAMTAFLAKRKPDFTQFD